MTIAQLHMMRRLLLTIHGALGELLRLVECELGSRGVAVERQAERHLTSGGRIGSIK